MEKERANGQMAQSMRDGGRTTKPAEEEDLSMPMESAMDLVETSMKECGLMTKPLEKVPIPMAMDLNTMVCG
jgi:hypothetical protein